MEQGLMCDTCEFTFKPDLKEELHYSGDYFLASFECPNCFARYDVYRITTKGVKLRKKLQELRKKTQSITRTNSVITEYQSCLKKVEKEITKLT